VSDATYAEEFLSEALIAEISALAPEHWDEVAVNKDARPLHINWERYQALNKAGAIRFFIMRVGGELAGYAPYAILDHMRYRGWKYAYADVCYVARRFRASPRESYRRYRDLQAAAEDWARSLGCREILAVSKIHRPLAPLLERMGYRAQETIYSKVL
jgi:GNAT superfamily N-acetyltransferase